MVVSICRNGGAAALRSVSIFRTTGFRIAGQAVSPHRNIQQEIIRFIISGGGEAAERSQGPPGKCIASPALLGFFRAEAIYFTHGSVMIRIQSLDLDLVGIILDAIHDGVSKRIVITANALIPTFIEEL